MRKELICLALITTLNVNAQSANPNNILGEAGSATRADQIPAGDIGYYYIPGAAAGADSMATPFYGKTFQLGAGANLNLNRGCGELNPFENMSGQLRANIQEKIDEFQGFISTVPQMIASSSVEYALAKINPDLYQLTQLNIDEYFELFEINVQTCEAVRSELMSNPDANPFDQYMQIAVADEWKRTIGSGEFVNSHDIKEKIAKRAAANGLPLADGKHYGGENQEPIDIIQSIATAGINTIVGRNDKSAWDSDLPTQDAPISRYFKNADELVSFLEEIYGNQKIKLSANNGTAVSSKAGVGVGKVYSELRNEYLEQIQKYVLRQITRAEFEKNTGILVPPAEMDDMRLAHEYQRQTMMENMAKQEAIDTISTKLQLAQDALRAGVLAPDMKQSSLSEIARKRYEEVYYLMMDDIAKIENSRY